MQINRYLDHAILKPEMTQTQVEDAVRLGLEFEVKSVCMRPCDIALAKKLCIGTTTEVSCVLSFPHGSNPAAIKSEEARFYIAAGVNEIDMVVNYGYIKSGMWDALIEDIKCVSKFTRPAGVGLKAILETAQLTLAEIEEATKAAIAADADFVKTSTGFYGAGAEEDQVRVMLLAADGKINVKPSGGIKDYARAKMFVDMGAHRLGVGYFFTEAICSGQTFSQSKENY